MWELGLEPRLSGKASVLSHLSSLVDNSHIDLISLLGINEIMQ